MNIFYSKYKNKNDNFESLIFNREFENTLFLFNDNARHHETAVKGGGNAGIRPYNKYSDLSKPRSAGIVTGNYKGFSSLEEGKDIIDHCFASIQELIDTHGYTSLVYSVDSLDDPTIGSGIFEIATDVKMYITRRIYDLGYGCMAYPVTNGKVDYNTSIDIDEELLQSI